VDFFCTLLLDIEFKDFVGLNQTGSDQFQDFSTVLIKHSKSN
jgi:hypothetical protein